jgi:hypothetical protein
MKYPEIHRLRTGSATLEASGTGTFARKTRGPQAGRRYHTSTKLVLMACHDAIVFPTAPSSESDTVVRRYIRDAELFDDNAAAGIGLWRAVGKKRGVMA